MTRHLPGHRIIQEESPALEHSGLGYSPENLPGVVFGQAIFAAASIFLGLLQHEPSRKLSSRMENKMTEKEKDRNSNDDPNTVSTKTWDEHAVYKVGDHYWIEGHNPISVIVKEVNELGQVRKGLAVYLSDYEYPEGKEFEVWDKRTRQ